MGPQFVLERILTIQIGHETYEDILVRNRVVPTVTNVEGFIGIVETLEEMGKMPQEHLLNSLVIKEDWPDILEEICCTLFNQKQ